MVVVRVGPKQLELQLPGPNDEKVRKPLPATQSPSGDK